MNLTSLNSDELQNDDLGSRNSKGALDDIFHKDIRPYIDIIESMREYGLEQDVLLPKIVVVGDQSSGKSSIIELISGIQLPRGIGIVTRCPLEIQLKKVSNEPWKCIVSYTNLKGQEIRVGTKDPEKVESLILKAQTDICSTKTFISKELIKLRVESSAENAPDLTLIDLPGISCIAIDDQPTDIGDQIRNIIMDYVKSENTIILCVLSGDLDISNNESINIACQVDKGGQRTIGVITKPDIADSFRKAEIMKVLEKNKIKLQKGFNLVKCRSSEQLKNEISLSEFLLNEMEFYENDDIFKRVKKSQLGAVNLSRKITVEFVAAIKRTGMKIQLEIETLLEKSKSKLAELPQCVPTHNKDKRSYIMKIATDLNEKIRNFLSDGESLDNINYYQLWRKEFFKFENELDKKQKDALETQFSAKNLQKTSQDYRGKEISNFLCFSQFERLMKPFIQSYKSHAIELGKNIWIMNKSELERLFVKTFSYLPLVEKDMKTILHKEFEASLIMTEEKIDFIFQQENIIFTMDSNFLTTWRFSFPKTILGNETSRIKNNPDKTLDRTYNSLFGSTENIFGKETSRIEDDPDETLDRTKNSAFGSTERSSETNSSTDQMLKHIKGYLKIVHARLKDNVPTAVMQCLLNILQESLRSRIIEYMSSDEIIEKIKETSQMVEERQSLFDVIEKLRRVKDELQSL